MSRSLKFRKSKDFGGSFFINTLVITFVGYFLVSCYNMVDFYQGGNRSGIFVFLVLVAILIFIGYTFIGKKDS